MNVSAKSEYGLRALMYLAERGTQGVIPAREIAANAGVPVKYLEQILKVIKDGGLVEGQVGIGGGYRLTRPASFITVGEAMRLLDGRLALASDEEREGGGDNSRPADSLKRLWDRIEKAILDVVDRTTIADLCAREAQGEARQVSSAS